MRIAVLMGGNSAERTISLRSGEAVAIALTRLGHEVIRFDPARRSLLELGEVGVDLAFVVLHGRGGEDGSLQAILEWLTIPYTGSGVLASALAMDKWRSKLIWQGAGLPVLPGFLIEEQRWRNDRERVVAALRHRIDPPWFVKPVHEGSSVGAGGAEKEELLIEQVEKALQYDKEVLVERWVRGRELTVAFVGETILPIVEIVAPGGCYDFFHKYESDATRYLCPAPLAAEITAQVQRLAEEARATLGCSGWGRLDLLLEGEKMWLLEMNTAPGMTDHSLVPLAAQAMGWSFDTLCAEIVATAVGHSR
ncbi:MAG: D-alanine--D-alanine ligase [Hydrogenophilus sp.]|nr:D-alanine--D-alanine ligase [Hydrogenophilus sp.]